MKTKKILSIAEHLFYVGFCVWFVMSTYDVVASSRQVVLERDAYSTDIYYAIDQEVCIGCGTCVGNDPNYQLELTDYGVARWKYQIGQDSGHPGISRTLKTDATESTYNIVRELCPMGAFYYHYIE